MSQELIGLVVSKVNAELESRSKREDYFNDPAAWSRDMLGITLWSKQEEIALALTQHKSVAVKAAHGTGKSWLVAILTCWWIDTRYPQVFVASTAPSQAQISAIVWRYIRQLKGVMEQRYKDKLIDHVLPGYITSDNKWKEEGGNELGFGRKPPDNKEDDSFQGIHDGYVLAIGDEAVGLNESMIDALGNITSNEGSRRIVICNPTNPASYVGKLFREKPANWQYFTISAFDSPNFTGGEGMSEDALSKLVGPTYVEDKKVEYGEDSPRYKSRVLGEFAWDMGDTLIKPEDLAIATDKVAEVEQDTPLVIGADIARFGKDWNVFYTNSGGQVRFLEGWPDPTPVTETARRLHQHAMDLNATEVRIDSVGVGGGVYDILLEHPERRYTLVSMKGGDKSPDITRWGNARAWWWDTLRSDIRAGKIDLDGEDERLYDELMGVEYKFNNRGGLMIESKDEMRKRGQKSPDFADAAVYASFDLTSFTDDPLLGYSSGDKIRMSPADFLDRNPKFLSAMTSW